MLPAIFVLFVRNSLNRAANQSLDSREVVLFDPCAADP
jgi:hypothetical protein